MKESQTLVLSKTKQTKSTMFLLPLLKISYNLIKNGFVNCYIGDIDKPEYDNHLFILVETKHPGHFNTLDETFAIYNFIDSYILYESYYMYIFEFPKEFKKDRDAFLKGAYSKFSDKSKKIIVPGEGSSLSRVFDKNGVRRLRMNERLYDRKDLIKGEGITREDELLSIPELEEEIFNIKTHFEWK